MQSLRLPGETDQEFAHRAERAATIAKILVDACLQNECMQEFIADPELPMYTVDSVKTNPTVRVEYEQAIAIGGIGETLAVTKSKYWGDGPWILPLEPDDELFVRRITYIYRENSLYNRRFEQRKRLKELLGKRHRHLVEKAKYRRHTQRMFLDDLTKDQAKALRRILKVGPKTFWRACRGRTFLPLPPRLVQREFDFGQVSGCDH